MVVKEDPDRKKNIYIKHLQVVSFLLGIFYLVGQYAAKIRLDEDVFRLRQDVLIKTNVFA